MAVMEQYSTPLGLGDHPFQVDVLSSTPGLFHVLQVASKIGRPLDDAEAQPGHEHVVLLLFDLCKRLVNRSS